MADPKLTEHPALDLSGDFAALTGEPFQPLNRKERRKLKAWVRRDKRKHRQ
jgi:hypothetical protein